MRETNEQSSETKAPEGETKPPVSETQDAPRETRQDGPTPEQIAQMRVWLGIDALETTVHDLTTHVFAVHKPHEGRLRAWWERLKDRIAGEAP